MASNIITQTVRKSRALGPSVKNLLSQYQVDLSQIVSSGPHQTLLKSDVLAYISQKNLRPNTSTSEASDRQPKILSKASLTPSLRFNNPKVTVFHTTDNKTLRSKYARNYPTQLEIDVINAGGLAAI